jgi:ABC-2 type transport system permease protein
MSSIPSGAPNEQAPSDTRTETPTATRYLVGFGGLFLVTLGVASVVAAGYNRGMLGAEWGYLSTAVGAALLLFHAFRDGDLEVRRAYGVLGGALLLLAVGVGVFPAKPTGSEAAVAGHLLLPWGALLGVVALLFLVAFCRHETEEPYRGWAHMALLGTGGLLATACVVVGMIWPDMMAGPGAVFGVLGVAYLCGYFTVTDVSDDTPHYAAVGLGVLGGVAVAYALFRTIGPEVLHRGPAALRSPDQSLGRWAVAGRVLLVLIGLSGLLALRATLWPPLVRYAVAGVGVVFAGLFVVGSFAAPHTDTPVPYLVPGGLLLAGLGAAFVAVAVAVTVDAPVVVLTRRELASFFYSPIAYVVLFANALVGALTYRSFLFRIGALGTDPMQPAGMDEPIVRDHLGLNIIAALAAPVLVAVITMRSFSEEKRSGTLEVLLTAPVNDWAVVLSKFVAALAFFMLCWVPTGLYLVALRHAADAPFDYRPLLSYYLAVFACGCGFVGFGVFVSSLTRNQIMAAVVVFAGLLAQFLTLLREGFDVGERWNAVLAKLDYYSLWNQALSGQLPLSGVCVQLSLGVLWVFLTVKVLEARRWA